MLGYLENSKLLTENQDMQNLTQNLSSILVIPTFKSMLETIVCYNFRVYMPRALYKSKSKLFCIHLSFIT